MLLRSIIIDDESRGISALKQLIEKYTENVKVIAEFTKPAAAIDFIEDNKPDIVFLDINMPGMDGFELLRQLNWKKFNLIFTTAHEEHGLKALKNNAVDYLLKPINYMDLKLAIDKIKKQLNDNIVTIQFNYSELLSNSRQFNKSRIMISSISGVDHVEIADILFLESQSNYVKIMLSNKVELFTRKTLKEFEAQLCDHEFNFMRIHNSYIINLNKASRYLKSTDEIILADTVKIPLSKARRDVFFKWMNI